MPYNYKKLLKNDNFCVHLNYSPPEALVDGCEEITEKVDIWALGCCLYFMIYKRDPFESSNSETIKQNIRTMLLDEVSNTEKPMTDKLLDALIKICLQTNVSERPSALQLIQQLDRLEREYNGSCESNDHMISIIQ